MIEVEQRSVLMIANLCLKGLLLPVEINFFDRIIHENVL